MTSAQTRQYRREIAVQALAEYRKWVAAGAGEPLDPEIAGYLASVAGWYLQERNRERVLAGETFAARKPGEYGRRRRG